MEVIQSWYHEEDSSDKTRIANDAFEAVKKHFEQSSSLNDEEKKIVTDATQIEDVHHTVADLLAKYKDKTEKTRKWLQRTAETICHYGTVLDVFVQHHPEYVSLVWGTMKLLFMSVMNHAETLKLLAKSISQVAGRLPRINILSLLYPTEQMRSAVEDLYSCILSFLLMAHAWCNESKLRHIYHSFTRPHVLRYGDVLERVTDCSNNIVELASVGSQAEIRVMHKSHTSRLDNIISILGATDKERKDQLDSLTYVVSRLEGSHREQEEKINSIISALEASGLTINDLLLKLETFHAIQASAQLNTNHQLSDLQRSQILSTFALTFEDPDTCYKQHLFFRRRRASGVGAITSTNKFWLSPKLARCSSSQDSSLIVVKGAFMSRSAMKDFGVDVIEALTSSAVPTVWALTSLEKARSTSISTAADLMKYLAYQALRLRGVAETEKQMALRYSQFHTSRTQKEWLQLFKQVITTLEGQVYLVVDLATVRPSLEGVEGSNFVQELIRMLGEISGSNMATRVKVILLVYEADWFKLLPEEVAESIISVKAARSTRSQTREMRHAVNTRVFRNSGPGRRNLQERRSGYFS
ncbi:hypothetical protein F4820DRAFT_459078 [Hypoxylon rubiginosum]|uniref:Uncharacterized protein n=1 Tax=Hypoxylon rubiginosum TaxID=110542 RepID=A0ACB9YYM2_9PEZI|nr:hypothetical protein F4820DRAFT_459078 [Hypoxylon rubiginosum]